MSYHSSGDIQSAPKPQSVARCVNAHLRHQPIGIFDSGIGGLSVAREIRRRMPQESMIYVGDTARVPWGGKPKHLVAQYCAEIGRFLAEQKVKLLVVACNTASAHAIEALRAAVRVPVVGVLEPSARAAILASSPGGQIGVLGTRSTVRTKAYTREIQQLSAEARVFEYACPLLVPLIEEGWCDHPLTKNVVDHYVTQLAAQSTDIDTLVLGCTHYTLIKQLFIYAVRDLYARNVHVIDSALTGAELVTVTLRHHHLTAHRKTTNDRFFFTDQRAQFQLVNQIVGASCNDIEHVDLISP